MALRRRIRWVSRHGLIRRTVQRQMRAGDLGSRLMIDPTIREDPYPYYDELRAQGRIVTGGLAQMSAHHDVCRPEADQNVAFSSGIHYCIGAALARLEGEVGLQTLFRRFPDLALTGAPHRRRTRVLRGYYAIRSN